MTRLPAQHRCDPTRVARRVLTIAMVFSSASAFPTLAFDLQGHRGTRGLAPENTLAAFAKAMAIGVTTLETDLAVTRDGVLIISHDPFLNPDVVRGADGDWLTAKGPPIRELTLAELKRYDIGRLNPESRYARQFPEQQPADGQRFPALTEVFDLVRASQPPVRLNIETKITPNNPEETIDAETFARLVVDAIRAAALMQRVTVQSFDWRPLLQVKKLAPGIETVCLTSETESFDTVRRKAAGPSPWHAGLDVAAHGGSLPRMVQAAGCGTWSPFWRNVTPELVTEARALGVKVVPWTVNDPADMARLVDMNVDGLITDYPNRLRKVMTDRGMPLP